jgi:hypothetical protein
MAMSKAGKITEKEQKLMTNYLVEKVSHSRKKYVFLALIYQFHL